MNINKVTMVLRGLRFVLLTLKEFLLLFKKTTKIKYVSRFKKVTLVRRH